MQRIYNPIYSLLILSISFLSLTACMNGIVGEGSDDAGLIIDYISPNPANPGDTIKIYGMQFSEVIHLNFLIMNNEFISADSLIIEAEPNSLFDLALEFEIPAALDPGSYNVLVVTTSGQLPSNSLELIVE